MINRINIQIIVGFFVILGLLAFAFLAVKLGGIGDLDPDHYTLKARFDSVSGLKEGADVEVAGVIVGKVKNISLDAEEYESVVEISIPNAVKLQVHLQIAPALNILTRRVGSTVFDCLQ